MAKIKDVINHLEAFAPRSLQENYDNSGLLTGSSDTEVTNILVSLDCTDDVIEEAIKKDCNLVVSHHPIIFSGLKKLTGSNYVERTVINAIKNDIAIYAIHTNLDNVKNGVNHKICEKLELKPLQILQPKNDLSKVVTFIPPGEVSTVTSAMYSAGAGNIGNYEDCSFQIGGKGTFRPTEEANPSLGKKGKNEEVEEVRVEMLLPSINVPGVLKALQESHSYEEVAYYVSTLSNQNQDHGAGMIGELSQALEVNAFLNHIKDKMELKVLKHTGFSGNRIKRVAVCGGSGSFLIKSALSAGVDAFITADVKYHDFFEGEKKMMIVDIGHYESEVFTKELLGDILKEKFTTFAVNLAETVTNPITYF